MSSLPRRVGPYRIIDVIGRGGMGVVYRGEHAETGETAAVKTVTALGKGLLQNIRREIHALARMRHPGIVRILDEGVVDGVPWYAMELLAGKTLRQHVVEYIDGSVRTIPAGQAIAHSAVTPDPSAPPVAATVFSAVTGGGTEPGTRPPIRRAFGPVPKVPLERTLTLVHRLCSPLAFLHGEGLVHRDLKPDNVLVRPNGSPVLVDFGVTTQFTGEQSREALEVGGEMVGTVSYMAPEQILGDFVDAQPAVSYPSNKLEDLLL